LTQYGLSQLRASVYNQMKEKIYKVRLNCASFVDVVVVAHNEKEAKEIALNSAQCPNNGLEFGEFLEVEKEDASIKSFTDEKENLSYN